MQMVTAGVVSMQHKTQTSDRDRGTGCVSVFAEDEAVRKKILLQNVQKGAVLAHALLHTSKRTQSNKGFCHVGPYMNDLSQESVQTNPLDSIRYSMKECAACQLIKFMQIGLARLL